MPGQAGNQRKTGISMRVNQWGQTEHLGSCDVNTICERCDHQPRSVAQILISIWERGITDADAAVVDALVPVCAELADPLETLDIVTAAFCDLLDHVSGVRINGDHVHDLKHSQEIMTEAHAIGSVEGGQRQEAPHGLFTLSPTLPYTR